MPHAAKYDPRPITIKLGAAAVALGAAATAIAAALNLPRLDGTWHGVGIGLIALSVLATVTITIAIAQLSLASADRWAQLQTMAWRRLAVRTAEHAVPAAEREEPELLPQPSTDLEVFETDAADLLERHGTLAWHRYSPSGSRDVTVDTAGAIAEFRECVDEAYRGRDAMRCLRTQAVSVLLIVSALTVVWALPEASSAPAPAQASAAQPQVSLSAASIGTQVGNVPPVAVRVTFLGGNPSIAAAPSGCTPAATDFAQMTGGTWNQPQLRFFNQGGPRPATANEPMPKRTGGCGEVSWTWTADRPDLVAVVPLG